ncbi:TetR/AcrR family transcriptional regulator [Jiangella rhizosphaerae]|uniref:TetR/AcrR family transcriptional regulator n=1 Tax=Jiangella rhizosphaerae TaxID=2293569 RepID=A0A418KMI9_9ACTN|nr:TetR/AcrR family transcriptional regulator [Jiangella rhizosphaerae]RIQ20158.1 TetR/AcrR family transcriptional regulator [Jiangella rhizosphaerae]
MAEAVERRKRYRQQVRDEIKQVALGQIARDGAAALTLTGVAKEIGVSGPALYKYFAGRDDLLTELIVDSYSSLAEALRAAATASTGSPARERLHAVAGAYRDWAVAQPHRYLLLAGTPVPRYDAPAETVDKARAVLAPLLEILAEGSSWPRAESLRAELAAWIAEVPAVAEWVRDALGPAASTPPDVALAGVVTAWVRLHGVVSIEAVGLFSGMGLRPATVLALEMDALADAVGLA